MSALPQNYKTIGLQGNDKTTYNMFGSRTAAHMLMTLNVASSFGGICMLHLAQSFCLCKWQRHFVGEFIDVGLYIFGLCVWGGLTQLTEVFYNEGIIQSLDKTL